MSKNEPTGSDFAGKTPASTHQPTRLDCLKAEIHALGRVHTALKADTTLEGLLSRGLQDLTIKVGHDGDTPVLVARADGWESVVPLTDTARLHLTALVEESQAYHREVAARAEEDIAAYRAGKNPPRSESPYPTTILRD